MNSTSFSSHLNPKLVLRSFAVGLAAIAATLSLAIVPSMLTPTPAAAQPSTEGPGPRGGKGGGVLGDLNLSEAQQRQLRDIREKNRGAMRAKSEELRREQEKLRDLMSGSGSERDIETQFNRVQALRQDMSRLHFSQMMAMRNVLTPAQRAQLEQRMKERRESMRQRLRDRGPRGGNRMPAGDDGAPPM